MLIQFHKLQSLGNDFVFVDQDQVSNQEIFTPRFFKKISNRHFGIGCDLSVVYKVKEIANDTTTVNAYFFNADGSKAEICGNATKCTGLLMLRLNGTSKCIMLAGEQKFQIDVKHNEKSNKKENKVSVIWDKKITAEGFDIQKISCLSPIELFDEEKIYINKAFKVSVGNPHFVMFLADQEKMPSPEIIKDIGAKIESDAVFPNRTNVEFAKKVSEDAIELQVFERGAGLTLACGSGAIATAVAARKGGIIAANHVTILQKGGNLQIDFLENGNCVQTSSAEYVFSGAIETEDDTQAKPKTDFDQAQTPKTYGEKLTIYTDGACSGNPGPGGWGFIIIRDDNSNKHDIEDNISEFFGGERNTTNNRMELIAVIQALEHISNNADIEIELYTDSQYVKNGITQWIKNWVKNNWKNSAKKPVKNQELWKRLLELTQNRKILWNWVRGHNGDKFNERVDSLARQGCEHVQQL